MQIVGASDAGKSSLLEYMIRQDIAAKRGVCLFDPHGTLYKKLLIRLAEKQHLLGDTKVVIVDPHLEEWAFGFNPLQATPDVGLSVRVDTMVNACAAVWGDEDTNQTPRLKRVLRSIFYCLAATGMSLYEAQHLLHAVDRDGLRQTLTASLPDPIFHGEWKHFNSLGRREFEEMFQSAGNRLLEFLGSPSVRCIIGQKEGIDLRQCMDEGAVVLVNLAQGSNFSQENADTLGALFLAELFTRASVRPEGSRPFYVYVDECYRYLNESVERMLDETRKRGVHLTLAHQRIGQLQDTYRNAIIAGAQSKIVFSLTDIEDADIMARNIFAGEFDLEKAKTKHTMPVVARVVPVWLSSESESSSESWSAFSASGSSEAVGMGEALNPLDQVVGTSSVNTSGLSESSGSTQSSTSGRSRGRHEGFRPEIEERPTNFYSLEEVIHLAASRIKNLPLRHAIVKVPGRKSEAIKTPTVQQGLVRPEKQRLFMQRTIANHRFVVSREAIDSELAQRQQHLLVQASSDVEEPQHFREPIRAPSIAPAPRARRAK